ncbi:NRPS protein [Claviceps sorghi]|nr:NRPS protein [Claviceps sorghi]
MEPRRVPAHLRAALAGAASKLRLVLPEHMVPAVYLPVRHLPMSESGKVDRRRLRLLLLSLRPEELYGTSKPGPGGRDTEEAGSGEDKTLRRLFALALDLPLVQIGPDSNFFELGGDSASAMRLLALAREQGVASLAYQDVFHHPTPRELAAAASMPGPAGGALPWAAGESAPFSCVTDPESLVRTASEQCGVGRADIEDMYPCTDLQQSLMASTARDRSAYVAMLSLTLRDGVDRERLRSSSERPSRASTRARPSSGGILVSHARNPRHYDEVIRWRVAGDAPVDAARLQQAWRQVVARHGILRTVFLRVSEESVVDQAVLREYRPDVSVCVGETAEEAQRPLDDDSSLPWHQLRLHRRTADDTALCLRIHHALVDGVSLQIIKRDVELAYQGRLAALDTPPSYREYMSYLHHTRLRRSASDEYWTLYLRGVTGCLFPTLAGEAAPERREFGAVDVELASSGTLARFCERHKLATTVVLHIVWAVVLQRYTGTDEVCFGYMTSGRHASVANVEQVVGPLFNMLVARIRLAYPQSLPSLMSSHQERFLSSLDHQHQPLAETLHSVGSSAGHLFNSMMTVVNDLPEGQGARRRPSAMRLVGDGVQSRSEYPITLNILNGADTVRMQLSYHTSLLGAESAQQIAGAFRFVLQRTLEQPGRRLADLQVMGDEQMRTAYALNRRAEPPLGHLIHETIQRRCLRSPDAPSVCAWDGDFTYGQLGALSSSLAGELIRRGAGPEATIPILVEKSRWTPVAVLAVLKSGSSFVLLDSSHPAARLGAMMLAIRPPVMIVSAQTRSKAEGLSADMIDMVEIGHRLVDGPDKLARWDEQVILKPSNAAYVVFTSGSTGKPKGAVVEHASLSMAAECAAARLHLDAASRVLQFSSHAWDVAVMDIVLTLRVGGCVCIPSEDERTGRLAQAADRMRVNWALLTPTVARLVRPEDLSHLRTLVLAGEALSPTDVSTWSHRVRLIQAYGPAECAAVCAVTEPLTASDDPRCVGRPCGCAAWVVNRANQELLAPPGAVGELVLEGPVVGRGYLGDPERSAAAFVRHPAWLRTLRGHEAPARLYKTGDLVRQDVRSGRLTFVGRGDDQVKIRGQRVEPGEVEAQVADVFPGSHVTVVVAERAGKAILVALVLDKDKGDGAGSSPPAATGNAIAPPSRAFAESARAAFSRLRETMPAYMVPSLVLPLRHLPRAATGKADRATLRDCVASLSDDQLGAHAAADVARRAASSAVEAELQELALQRPPHAVPLDEDLFRVGLDSLTAMTLTTTARRRGWEIPVALVFQHARLSDLALVLAREHRGPQQGRTRLEEAPVPNPVASFLPRICAEWHLDEGRIVHAAPTTHYQQRCLAAGHDAFVGLHFSRPVSARALASAAARVVEHHSILRTVFVPFQDSYVQLALRTWCHVMGSPRPIRGPQLS